jgi:hypothetical protein
MPKAYHGSEAWGKASKAEVAKNRSEKGPKGRKTSRMSKAEQSLLNRARDQYGSIEPCAGKTLQKCFFSQNGFLQLWFNDATGNTHMVFTPAGKSG